MADIEKILTDVPFLDEVIYHTKILAIGTILKNETDAANAETVDSARASHLYIASKDNTILFDEINFTLEMLEMSSIPPELYDSCLIDYENIPVNKRPELMAIAKKSIIDRYVEQNNYYRMLNGLPDLGDEGIIVDSWTPPDGIVIDLDKHVHEMSLEEIQVLETYGVLDKLKEEYPDKVYLNHLGIRRVDPYKARKAIRFEPLYIPSVESQEIADRYKTRLLVNRVFTLKTIYSEAFKYGSEYYDNFISILIVVQTIVDVLSAVQEFIARKEIFDIRSVQFILQSYGVPFYSEIPLKYQIAMVKNINTLIKYKSTTKNMVDICSLFGFDNIEIFKYYLLKYQNMEKPEDAPPAELKFIRVPLEEQIDDYLKDSTNYYDYDTITYEDGTWDGGLDHNKLKEDILAQEFNHIRTKYISIDTIYDMTKLSFDISYFFNILYDDVALEEALTVNIPYIDSNTKFRLTDVFCYLFALTYEYNGIEDIIMDTTGKVLHVMGFNFKANMAELAAYVEEKGFTLEELGVSDFRIPETSLVSYNQLLEIFVRNNNIRDHLIKQMKDADNKQIYDIYKYLFEALMITEFTNNYFRDPDTGLMPATYTEYLQRRSTPLFLSLIEVKAITDPEAKMQKISSIINATIYALDEYIDSDVYKNIYNGFPSVSSEAVKQYVVKMINFFKSYKIDLLGINTLYKFNDKLDNFVKIIDCIHINRIFWKDDYVNLFNKLYSTTSNLSKQERIKLVEKVYFDIKTWVYKTFGEVDPFIVKEIIIFTIARDLEDRVDIRDDIHLTIKKELIDYFNTIEKHIITSSLLSSDKVVIRDGIAGQILSRGLDDEYAIFNESIMFNINKTHNESIILFDTLVEFISSTMKKDSINITEQVYINPFKA